MKLFILSALALVTAARADECKLSVFLQTGERLETTVRAADVGGRQRVAQQTLDGMFFGLLEADEAQPPQRSPSGARTAWPAGI
jgi:hypothetical protein